MSAEVDQESPVIPDCVELSVSNIGGIDETTVSFQKGVTVLAGRNATNRTSLLQGIMAAMGSDQVSLKADATEGEVSFEGEQHYDRQFRRKNGAVISSGEPYLEDAELADLFAFLLESNEARRAVARSDDLRELIMRPVDTVAINSRIEALESRKRTLDEKLSELDSLENQLPDLRTKREKLSREIDSLREELEQSREELNTAERDFERGRGSQSALAATMDSLQEARSELTRVRDRIETERESIDALQDERETVREQLDELPPERRLDRDELDGEIDALRKEKTALDEEISRLQSTIQFNQQRLDDPDDVPGTDADSEELTQALVSGDDDQTLTCWSCGSTVDRGQIETTIDQLREFRQTKLQRRNEIQADIEKRQADRDKIESVRRERENAEQHLSSLEAEIRRRKERLEALVAERGRQNIAVAQLESIADDLEASEYDEILEEQKRLSKLSVRIENKERERDELVSEIQATESRLDEREGLAAEREEISQELLDLRNRVDRIESDAVEAFNEHMATLLEMLEYENLERVWIERTKREVRDGLESVTKSSFELRIVRTTGNGAAYEDSIEHLSESEREVIGLVFALAGYLVHDVYETVPFMLLDSLEAIDAERITTLVEYFEDFVPYLVVALLEEDAEALARDYDVIRNI